MRKYMICVAVAVAAIATGAIAKAADPIQTLDVTVSPSKLDKKKFKPIQLGFDIKTGPNSGATLNQDQPPNATKTVVDFPKNLKIDTEAVPRCKVDPGALENTSTEQAIDLCGKKSIISVPGKSFSIAPRRSPVRARLAPLPRSISIATVPRLGLDADHHGVGVDAVVPHGLGGFRGLQGGE